MCLEWQSNKTERAWDFEVMEVNNSLDICMMRPLCERKKLQSVEVPVTMAYVLAAKPISQLTQKGFLLIRHCHRIGQLRYLGAL